MTLPLVLDMSEEETLTVTLDGHDKHNYLSCSQHKGSFRVLTATPFTVFKEVSKNQRAAFSFTEEPLAHKSKV